MKIFTTYLRCTNIVIGAGGKLITSVVDAYGKCTASSRFVTDFNVARENCLVVSTTVLVKKIVTSISDKLYLKSNI
jgi:hypothetical protein